MRRWGWFLPTHLIDYVVIEVSKCITYSVLITIRICRPIPLPEDFCGVDKTVDKYVPVDMNKQVYESRVLLV